jgi:hypothetical protein
MDVRHPEVTVQLTGTNGNVFALTGAVGHAMKRAGVDRAEIQQFYEEVQASQSYDEALRVMMRWVDTR